MPMKNRERRCPSFDRISGGCRGECDRVVRDRGLLILARLGVGVDKEHDRARGFVVSRGGITVVGKGKVVTP